MDRRHAGMPTAERPVAVREEALARVLAHRERGRRRPPPARIALAVLGAALLVAAVPLMVVLPEGGIPALLLALRLLAVEADWAARAYAWIDWRARQAHAWFGRRSRAVRTAVLAGLLVLALALVWLLVHGLL
jgi:hypothetical protein